MVESNHEDDDDAEQEYEDFVDGLTDGAAQYEVVSAVEDAIAEVVSESGAFAKKVWIDEEGSCELCQTNVAAGAIDIADSFPSGDDSSPAHGRCRCNTDYL